VIIKQWVVREELFVTLLMPLAADQRVTVAIALGRPTGDRQSPPCMESAYLSIYLIVIELMKILPDCACARS
jgi:hypothetical protein